jgi:hypothetical protein
MNGPKATSALSPFDSQLRTLVGADHRHRRLLRARRERPRRRCTTEQRYELAASQFIELHSSPSGQGRIAEYRIGEEQSGGRRNDFTTC